MESRLRNCERTHRPETLKTIQHNTEDSLSYTSLNKNYRIPKMTTEDREYKQMLKDSGIDTKGMTKDEILQIVKVLELSKQEVPENPYEEVTQTDQSASTSPKNVQSRSASQESIISDRGSEGLGQSHLVSEHMVEDEDSGEQSNPGGSNKPVSRMSFRLSDSPEEEGREDVNVVNKKQAGKKMATAVDGSTKSSGTSTGPDLNGGMIDKVVRTCRKASASVFKSFTPKRKTTQSPVIIPDFSDNEEQSEDDFEIKVSKNSHKRTIVESSDDDTQEFVPEKQKNVSVSKRMKLSADTETAVQDKQEEDGEGPLSLAQSDLEYFKQDLEDKNTCRSLGRHYRKVRRRSGKNKNLTPLYAPDTKKVENWTRVILQVFEIYHRKLFHLQSKSQTYLEPGEPVKAGRHAEKTIDIKRRGQQEVEIFNSIEDDDVEIAMENNAHGQFSLNENSTDLKTNPANKDDKTGPRKMMRALRLVKPRRRANKDKDTEKNVVDFVENEEDVVEVQDKGSQVAFSPAGKEDVELSEYFMGGNKENHLGAVPEENHLGAVPEEKIVKDRHTPDILIEEDTDIFPKSIRKPAPRRNGKVLQGGGRPEKQLQFNVKTLRSRVTKSENNESGTLDNNESKLTEKFSKAKLKRHHSDISTASSDSTSRMEEDFIQELAKKDKLMKAGTSHPTKSPEILINPDGDVYATQMCAMEEKHSNNFEENGERMDTQLAGNHFKVGDGKGKINPSPLVSGKTRLKDNSKCVDETDKFVQSSKVNSVDEIVGEDSDQEVIFNVKSPGEEKAQKNNPSRNQNGEVRLNIKRRSGPSKARKFQIPDPDDDHDAQTSSEVKVKAEEDVKVDSDDEWLSVRHWTKDKQTTKTYARRTKTNENSHKPPPKISGKVSCPMCYKKFDSDHIEDHAAQCEGESNVDDAHESMDTETTDRNQGTSSTPEKMGLCIVCEEPLAHRCQGYAHPQCLEEATQAQHMVDNKSLHNMQAEEPRTTRSRGRSSQSKSANQNTERSNIFEG